MRRDHCIAALTRHRTDQIVVAAYNAAFDLMRIQPHPLNYLSVGAMGLPSSHALGWRWDGRTSRSSFLMAMEVYL